jgi:hypothetical protein
MRLGLAQLGLDELQAQRLVDFFFGARRHDAIAALETVCIEDHALLFCDGFQRVHMAFRAGRHQQHRAEPFPVREENRGVFADLKHGRAALQPSGPGNERKIRHQLSGSTAA